MGLERGAGASLIHPESIGGSINLITRSPVDDRLELTAEGVDLAARGADAYRVSRERVLAALSEADLRRLDTAVTGLLGVLEDDQANQADLAESA